MSISTCSEQLSGGRSDVSGPASHTLSASGAPDTSARIPSATLCPQERCGDTNPLALWSYTVCIDQGIHRGSRTICPFAAGCHTSWTSVDSRRPIVLPELDLLKACLHRSRLH